MLRTEEKNPPARSTAELLSPRLKKAITPMRVRIPRVTRITASTVVIVLPSNRRLLAAWIGQLLKVRTDPV